MFNFTPDEKETKISIPYFEDARADFAPYYSARQSLKSAESQVVNELAKLDAGAILLRPGKFGDRYGYLITFQLHATPGVIRVAGLPTRSNETEKKIEQVRVQALLNVRDWLKAAVTAQVFSPGSNPLSQHLLVDGQRTVADYITTYHKLPQIESGGEVTDGDFSEM